MPLCFLIYFFFAKLPSHFTSMPLNYRIFTVFPVRFERYAILSRLFRRRSQQTKLGKKCITRSRGEKQSDKFLAVERFFRYLLPTLARERAPSFISPLALFTISLSLSLLFFSQRARARTRIWDTRSGVGKLTFARRTFRSSIFARQRRRGAAAVSGLSSGVRALARRAIDNALPSTLTAVLYSYGTLLYSHWIFVASLIFPFLSSWADKTQRESGVAAGRARYIGREMPFFVSRVTVYACAEAEIRKKSEKSIPIVSSLSRARAHFQGKICLSTEPKRARREYLFEYRSRWAAGGAALESSFIRERPTPGLCAYVYSVYSETIHQRCGAVCAMPFYFQFFFPLFFALQSFAFSEKSGESAFPLLTRIKNTAKLWAIVMGLSLSVPRI